MPVRVINNSIEANHFFTDVKIMDYNGLVHLACQRLNERDLIILQGGSMGGDFQCVIVFPV